jgi:hypothetical protein
MIPVGGSWRGCDGRVCGWARSSHMVAPQGGRVGDWTIVENPSSPQLLHRPFALQYLVQDTAASLSPLAPHSHRQLTLPTAAFALHLSLLPTPTPAARLPDPNGEETRVVDQRLDQACHHPDHRLKLNAKIPVAFFTAASLSPLFFSAVILRLPGRAFLSRSALTNATTTPQPHASSSTFTDHLHIVLSFSQATIYRSQSPHWTVAHLL